MFLSSCIDSRCIATANSLRYLLSTTNLVVKLLLKYKRLTKPFGFGAGDVKSQAVIATNRSEELVIHIPIFKLVV